MKNLSIVTILLIFIGVSAVNANNCTLNGVSFSGLSDSQVKAINVSGGKCTQNTSSFKFGDKSYFVIDGQRQDFVDIQSEDPYDLNMKKFSYTGYISSYIAETERHKIWGYRFDTSVNEGGDYLENISMMQSGESIPMLAIADALKQSNEEAKSERKAVFKFLNKAKSQNAIVQITGLMRNFSNSGDLYLELDTYKIIETLK
ncbi:hypothetical protein N9M89_06245 [Amylibacter sp.]|nr:hypothetical protein [Amylibacter sp.]